ncbi:MULTISPECIES: two-component system sensor histidine kinase KdpD [Pantoea]|jgi:two-component system sensor histidine kinase KdpD|uniref:histidine kinase n=5 Tax=Bacteria TaxID=2 RepID=A0A379A9B3_ENTAG|nr:MULTISPECIES: two-component system sensor histidine kinase KdpD [Pantoea]AOE39411.1 two-component system sensor histidine kinase KdbD [Pantoea agglomerans]AYP21677.1 two-component system sensor histidine kinase KdbD [Pantoea agglomerans]ERM10609.1 sensor protein KdpD [Pantoea agglomerans Tx10]KAF6675782.1 two-component system sensor histidine kinase KdbD [Pantoea sp. EKM20T]KEY41139.1 sensor protein KdpD [Pantoea agglomerans]
MNHEPQRPDPDALLQANRETHRGQLKIYFGACAGVGKTYAMLQEAQRLRAQGLDVLIGVVETHDRPETAQLLTGLTLLPRRATGRSRHAEFDLDAALARHPAVILMDELAHTNVQGSRHPKRWQDIEELLEAGIDVLTTVNVQHLESLNDVVGGVTGIQVRETVPDPFFDSADEVVLVDLPPDDLRQRLKEGKVYIGDRAERAIENFFRKGNLFALRELALRRTADRVDDQMRAWRDQQGRERVWHTRDAILLCIGDDSGSEKLVRTAARLAARLGSEWHAVYVETPRLHRLPEARRRAILRTLQLAQELGAETATLSEPDEAEAVLGYARAHNLGKIVTGRRPLRRWRRDSFAERLGQLGPDLDLLVVALDEPLKDAPHPLPDGRVTSEKWRIQLRGVMMALVLCILVTAAGQSVLIGFDPANCVMIYLLAVVIVALRYGRWPSVIATVMNIVAFDLFFVAPTGTVAVSDLQYLVTFGVMLAVGVIVGNLTAGVRYQARVARYREQRARQLYEMAKSLGSALTPQDIAATSQRVLDATLQARCLLLLPDEQGELQPVGDALPASEPDRAIAKWSYSKGQPAGAGTDTLPAVPYQILPLKSGAHCRGLLVVEPQNLRQLMIPEQQRLVETFTVLIANALERMALSHSEAASRLSAEREQLRNALLSALSHDLRTPLTVLFGQAEMLMLDLASDNSKYVPQASQIREQTLSTIRLVSNMLDMARIQSGGLNLREEWLALEEVVGGALSSMAPSLKGHEVRLDLPDDIVLIKGDSTLLERVFTNLIENSLKYAGNSAPRGIRAWRAASRLEISVWDSGPGIAEDDLSRIFDKFWRGDKESAVPGVGLGLAICKTIIESHGGQIWAENRAEGGAAFRLSLPLPPVPEISDEGLK